MKIALYINGLNGGGAEHVVSRLSHILSANGHEVFIIVNSTSETDYSYSGELLCINKPVVNGKLNKILAYFERARLVKRIKKAHRLDCVISFLEGPNFVNVISGKQKCKTILSVRNYQEKEFEGSWKIRFVLKQLYKKADYIIACSKLISISTARAFSIPVYKIGVLYNPFDINEIKHLASTKAPDPVLEFSRKHELILASTGRMTFQKGFNHLIRIMSGLVEKGNDVGLIIVGKGEEQEKVERLIEDLKLTGNIFLAGFQSNPYSIENCADAYIMPSLFDGFPNALAEAMAVGLPVISSDCKSGPREILSPNLDLEYESKIEPFQEYGIILPALSGSGSWTTDIEPEEQVWIDFLSKIEKSDLEKYRGFSENRASSFSYESTYNQLMKLLADAGCTVE